MKNLLGQVQNIGSFRVHSKFGSKSLSVYFPASYLLTGYQSILSYFVYFISFVVFSDPLFYFLHYKLVSKANKYYAYFTDKEIGAKCLI